jgi:hypothetical protein
MAQFAETPDRQRNPLGGREVDGFDQWLRVTAQTMCETEWDLPGRLRTDNPMRHVAVEASSHYGTVLGAWKAVQKGHGGDAKYVGVSELTVHACQSDQAALMALRNTRN